MASHALPGMLGGYGMGLLYRNNSQTDEPQRHDRRAQAATGPAAGLRTATELKKRGKRGRAIWC
ncbi:MAG TPA: hypothetical protein VM492_06370 [Sumerlaeia bacterium]|nr:hypothetical protein [Sumerlaeia bacterium]